VPINELSCQCSELMRKEGLESLFPMEEIAIMGLWELLPHICSIKVQYAASNAYLSVNR
jgi:lipid A disaccharide synthetase